MKTPDRIELGKEAHYFIDNLEVDEPTYRERHPLPKGGGIVNAPASGAYPYAADSLAVHSSQVEEARAASVAIGVPTNFTPDGKIIWESRDHQRRYCQATGYVNRDENWSGRGSQIPPEPPKKRPRI